MVNLTPTRVSALAAVYREGTYGAADTAPGVVIAERRNLNLWILRGASSDHNFMAAAQSVFDVTLSIAPGTAASVGTASALCLAPDEWLISDGTAITGELTVSGGTCVDVSHGRTVLRVSGPRTRVLLAKGCGLDLHPSVFRSGHCAQTAIARINVLMHLRDQDGAFDLYCSRSYALSFWRWVATSAAEFGYRVATPLMETP